MHLQSWARERPRLADGALAGLACLLDLLLFSSALDTITVGGPARLLMPAVVAPYCVLAWRRAAPLPVLAFMVVHFSAVTLLVPELRPQFGVLIALYTVGARRAATAALARPVTFVVLATVGIVDELSRPLGPGDTPAGVVRVFVVVTALSTLSAWGVGRFARATRQSARYQHELAELQRLEAVRAERAALAHDLHDVIAHAVVMMMLGASAARLQIDRAPDRAAASLKDVEEAGARAMDELRAMLDVLRDVDASAAPVAADAALADLEPLIDSARRAGLVVTQNRTGRPRRLEPGVDLAAVRIVQEALTNATKHAGPGTRVEITVRWTGNGLVLRVADDGRGVPVLTPAHRSARIGLAGLRERACSVGGRLAAGPREGGGFEVLAELPITEQAPPASAEQARPQRRAGPARPAA